MKEGERICYRAVSLMMFTHFFSNKASVLVRCMCIQCDQQDEYDPSCSPATLRSDLSHCQHADITWSVRSDS